MCTILFSECLGYFVIFFFSSIIGKKNKDKYPAVGQTPKKALVLLGIPLFLHQPSLCAAGQVPRRCGDSSEKQFTGPALTSAQHREEQQAEGGREVSSWGREVGASLAPPKQRRDIRFPSRSLPSSLACLPSSPGPDNPAHLCGFQQ